MNIIGTVSKKGTYFNTNNMKLYVRGWFLSKDGYDEIRVNGLNAKIREPRLDVYKNFPQYNNKTAGFFFEQKCTSVIRKVKIEIIKDGNVIYTREEQIESVTYGWNEKKRIVLIGGDLDIKQFYFRNRNNINIEYYFEEDNYDIIFSNLTKITKNELSEDYIYVIGESKKKYWSDMLRNLGLHEFRDFYDNKTLDALINGKKIVLLHGNCHMSRIEQMFNTPELNKNFYVYPVPLIYLNKQGYIEDDVISNVDIFIHQDIRDDNVFGYRLSDSYLRNCQKKVCQDICIPNLFGVGRAFFPNAGMSNKRDHCIYSGMKLFPYEELLIQEKDDCFSFVNKIKDNNLWSYEYVKNNFDTNMEKLKQREKNCDVIISDYIIDNYKKYRCFWDVGHPTNRVIKEICQRIIKKIGGGYSLSGLVLNNEMDTYQMPIYNCVIEKLSLEYEDIYLRENTGNHLGTYMDINDYAEEYLFWCYS